MTNSYLEQIKNLLENDDDWIFSRRYGFSASKLAKKYPDGVPEKILTEVLQSTQEELDQAWEEIVEELKEIMKV